MSSAWKRLRFLSFVAMLQAVLTGCGETTIADTPHAAGVAPAISMAFDTSSISTGSSAILSWSTTDATACVASGDWSGPVATSGSARQVPATVGAHHYALSCTSAQNASSNTTATLTVVDFPVLQSIGTGVSDDTGSVHVDLVNPGLASALDLVLQAGQEKLAGAEVTIYATGPDAGAVVYAVSTGGGVSGDSAHSNSAAKLIAVLGTRASFLSAAVLNPSTTIAATWAFAQFIDDEGRIRGDLSSLGLAAATAAELVDSATGAPAADLGAGENSPQRLNSLSNLLNACVASQPGSPACDALFDATPTSGKDPPTDTLAAAIAIAQQPGQQVDALFQASLADQSYQPCLASMPSDWSLSLTYQGGGLSAPTGLAIDSKGNVWVANYNDSVSEFSPTGVAIAGAEGFTGGGLHESFGIAVDRDDRVWVSNQESDTSINGGRGSLSLLVPETSPVAVTEYSGAGLDFPYAVAVDLEGNVWAANYGNSSLSELDGNGSPVSPATGYTGGGLSFPVALAVDANDALWIANNGAAGLSKFSSDGVALSPSGGYSGGGVDASQGVAVDPLGNVWSSNYYHSTISELASDGDPRSAAGGDAEGSDRYPGGMAIDGAGRVWIANFRGQSLTELQGASDPAPGSMLSPAQGFLAADLDGPFQPAIDRAGNIWVAGYYSDRLVKFIGLAAPVRTPQIGPSARP